MRVLNGRTPADVVIGTIETPHDARCLVATGSEPDNADGDLLDTSWQIGILRRDGSTVAPSTQRKALITKRLYLLRPTLVPDAPALSS